jgi:hypothetical protein
VAPLGQQLAQVCCGMAQVLVRRPAGPCPLHPASPKPTDVRGKSTLLAEANLEEKGGVGWRRQKGRCC